MGSIRRAIGVLVAASAVTLAAAAPANAGLLVSSAENCEAQPASQVFLRWLDPLRYEQAPGGDAESAKGWTLSGGAKIVSGNEPWKVGGGSDSRSLQLPRGSRATTGVMCVGITHPVMRFFRAAVERLAARLAEGGCAVRGRRRWGQQPAGRRRAGRREVAADAAVSPSWPACCRCSRAR